MGEMCFIFAIVLVIMTIIGMMMSPPRYFMFGPIIFGLVHRCCHGSIPGNGVLLPGSK